MHPGSLRGEVEREVTPGPATFVEYRKLESK